jgi:hypothetical protein
MKRSECVKSLKQLCSRLDKFSRKMEAKSKELERQQKSSDQIEYALCRILPATLHSMWIYGSLLKVRRNPADIDTIVVCRVSTIQEDYADEKDMAAMTLAGDRLFKTLRGSGISPRIGERLEDAAGSDDNKVGNTFFLIWKRDEPSHAWKNELTP